MSTTKVQMPVQRREAAYTKSTACNPTTNNNVPRGGGGRQRSGGGGRKRAFSFASAPPYKRRCKTYDYGVRPPTKFLLGGNIHDPLNLNSLQDEAINREMNAATPKSSPLPTPRYRRGAIDVIIPPNLHDPLNLLTSMEDDAEYEQNLVSPVKRGRKKNRKKKRNSLSGCSAKENAEEGASPPPPLPPTPAQQPAPTTPEVTEGTKPPPVDETTPQMAEGGACRNLDLPLKKDAPKDKPRKCSVKDKIVSPVIPQPRLWTRPHGHRTNANKHHQKPQQTPNFKAKNTKYQYGNYNRYYGYRNQNVELDVRLKVFSDHRHLFFDKDILDIGCNVGHISLCVARDLGARSVVGLDIDQHLVDIARKNVRHYVNLSPSPGFYPISMPIVYGPVDVAGVVESPRSERKKFPDNVTFVQGSYVLDSDALLEAERACFDVILCLSVTKWMHVNWGDAGLKQAFQRMFAQLRPGGRLILEAQGWESYRKRKTLTETIYKNYNEIRFFPQSFTEYLLSEVGFATCEVLPTPPHPSRGFRRPIQLFTKGSFSSSYSAPNTPFHLVAGGGGGARVPVYTPVVVSTRSVEEDEAFEQAGSSQRVPEESSSQRVPEESSSQTVPEESSSQTVPDESSSKTVPEESSSQTVPEESSSQTVPEESSSQTVPEESSSQTVPEEEANRPRLQNDTQDSV